MLTRLYIDGFKNLHEVDLHFGSFTCIAGPNGAGKSNLFDAISFVSALADRPLIEAALSVRGDGPPAGDPASVFLAHGDGAVSEMRFIAEMLIAGQGIDDLGQSAEASSTFLRYSLILARGTAESPIRIREEKLDYVSAGNASEHLPFPHSSDWRRGVVSNRRRKGPYISTEVAGNQRLIKLHQEGSAGRAGQHRADSLARTVLSSVNAAENPTALLARRELQSWRQLQLEPSALRTPDSYRDERRVSAHGAHMPATLLRLAGLRPGWHGDEKALPKDAAAVYARVANRLAELLEGVQSIRVDDDQRRELLSVVLRDRNGTDYEARALSDGTLRFLALAVLAEDPEANGLICLEEPENGIHPDRVPAMLRLIQDLAVDSHEPAGPENPLRQVIVNTHSPLVVTEVPDDSLLGVTTKSVKIGGRIRRGLANFAWLSDTWRASTVPGARTMSKGQLLSYLLPATQAGDGLEPQPVARKRRVKDRQDVRQLLLPHETLERTPE